MIRCFREAKEDVRAAAALMREVQGAPVRLETVGCAGSLRTLRAVLADAFRRVGVRDPEAALDRIDIG